VHALTGRRFLIAGGTASFALAAVHVLIIAIGPPAYLYFGRPDLAAAADSGSLMPPLVTAGVTFLLSVWGVYGYSGGRVIRRVPLLRTGLVTVTVLYLARGLVLVADYSRWLAGEEYPPRQAVFSATALAIGLCYAVGTWQILRKSVDAL
jgi:hypothetical protein